MDNFSRREQVYVVVGTLYVTCIITANLIFQKIVSLKFLGLENIEISVGALLFPVCFLLTDFLAEFYSRRATETIIFSGLVCSLFTIGVLSFAQYLPATSWSPLSDDDFSKTFGNFKLAFLGSLLASFLAQLADVRLFQNLKSWTKGKHLWLRNNLSTAISQGVDTVIMTLFLTVFGVWTWEQFFVLFLSTYSVKFFCALLDTPLFYLGVRGIKAYLKDPRTS